MLIFFTGDRIWFIKAGSVLANSLQFDETIYGSLGCRLADLSATGALVEEWVGGVMDRCLVMFSVFSVCLVSKVAVFFFYSLKTDV